MNKKALCWLEVNFDNIEHNFMKLKELNNGKKVCAVIKANAYGLGSCEVARFLESKGVDFFAVARIEEALELRRAGIKSDILCLGYVDESYIVDVLNENLIITVCNKYHGETISKKAKELSGNVRCHVKLDTGMHRLGFNGTKVGYKTDLSNVFELKNLNIEGIYTHLAGADELNKESAFCQIKAFNDCIDHLDLYSQYNEGIKVDSMIKHCSNSAASIDLNDLDFNMIRLGVSLYGYYPSNYVGKDKVKLKPSIKLKTVVTNVNTINAGDGVGYGFTYRAEEDGTKIATIAIGYADGFNRGQSNPVVVINGKVMPVVGRVCMDQSMVKVPCDFEVKIGDEVVVIDDSIEAITLDKLAERSKTINYEVLTSIGRRVTRVYRRTKLDNVDPLM